MNKKINVILLCHFSSSKVQEYINPFKSVNEYGQWIPNLVELFENKNDISLHVIATHEYISKTKIFEIDGIKYYFINRGIPLIGRHWPGFLPVDVWLDYYGIKRKVKQLVNHIQPDIIHLHGAENAYHTAAVPQFYKKLPILVTIQGFVSKSTSKNFRIKRRQKREKYILENFKYFTYDSDFTKKELKRYNEHAKLFNHQYVRKFNPINIEIEETEKIYDLVFFARITKQKGIEDFLKVVSFLKPKKNEINAIVIGSGSQDYIEFLKSLADKLGVSENIKFTGFLPTQKDVHELVQQAKVSVFPTYNDVFSGTVAESMYLKVPLVTYNTGGIPIANEKDNVISIAPQGDWECMANTVYELLQDEKLRKERAEKAYKRSMELFDNNNTCNNLVDVYKKVLHDFYNNTNN